ncbi:hypothetical protein COLO4_36010 [Corchorus olitorius]|uniref:RRM domain-containing protein n=1 Tax=Corchorus olitorius TaxID=93759 RepID=A0A1R3GBF0_9ROSI|nr:hypothetical protein COLO4_36010 [Corchorus olitorius]
MLVGNLHRETTLRMLWRCFSEFGVVVDAFIPNQRRIGARGIAYAFVRYRKTEEADKAIENGNGVHILNQLIRVRSANVERKNLGDDSNKMEENVSKDATSSTESIPMEEMSFDVDIPQKDMEWLQSSAMGKLKSVVYHKVIQDALVQQGVGVVLRPLNDLDILLTFFSKDEMDFFLKELSGRQIRSSRDTFNDTATKVVEIQSGLENVKGHSLSNEEIINLEGEHAARVLIENGDRQLALNCQSNGSLSRYSGERVLDTYCEASSTSGSRGPSHIGAGRREKRRAVRRLVFKEKLDMVFIQETKMQNSDEKCLKKLWGKGGHPGNGENLKFWSDVWAMETTLREAFPRIHALAIRKDGRVSDFGNWDETNWKLKDKFVWRYIPGGDYSAISFCKAAATNESTRARHWKLVWSGLAPPKVEVLV